MSENVMGHDSPQEIEVLYFSGNNNNIITS